MAHGHETGITINDQVAGIIQEAIIPVREIAADLLDPCRVGTWCDASNVDSACLQVHDGQQIERDESVPCPDLDSREVGGKD